MKLAFALAVALALGACNLPAPIAEVCSPTPAVDPFLVTYGKNLSISRDVLSHIEKADFDAAPSEPAKIAVIAHYEPAWDAYTTTCSVWFDAFNVEPSLVDDAHKRSLSGAWQSFQAAIDASQPPAR